MSVLTFILSSVLLSSAAQLMLKIGAGKAGLAAGASPAGFLLAAAINPFVVGGVFMHVAALALWLFALRDRDVSYAYPFIALGFVLVLVMSALWLREPVGASRIAGVALIVGGLVLVGRS
jgi:multidrug transporter EmrE-like cation transporter